MSNLIFSAQSETGILTKVFLQEVSSSFVSQPTLDEEWKQLNYLDCPNFELALKEYNDFKTILEQNGIEITYFTKDETCSIDSIYCRDASIVTDHGVILCNMGKQQRVPEPNAQAKVYEKNGISILGSIKSPGTLEGGDVAWINKNTLAVAHGYRTNQSGFDQLHNLLSPFGIELIQVDLPHYKGPSDVFHLMSIFSPITNNKAVVYSPLISVKFRNNLLDRGFQLIEVPDQEFESMGCNVLSLSPSKCLMVEGNPITKSRIEATGIEVVEYKGKHISILGGGGPTCLTRPLKRHI